MMRTEKKTSAKNSAGRLIMAALMFVLQIVWTETLVLMVFNYAASINLVFTIIAIFIVLISSIFPTAPVYSNAGL